MESRTPDETRLTAASAVELGTRLRAREITATALVTAHIDRLRRADTRIHAVTHEMFAEALERARAADALAARVADSRTGLIPPDALPPLHGLPFTVKGGLALAGHPWVGGSHYRRDVIAGETAPYLARLLAAGAIPIAITNVPEALTWIESANRVHGRTRNPFDLARTPGGSSGGEAAVLAAGGSVFGVGTDFGGSLRIPAAFCGVAAFKPSGGLIPPDGMWPEATGALARIACAGPLARRASDLPLLARVMAATERASGFDAASVDVRRLRVWFYDDNGESRACAEVRGAVAGAARALGEMGCKVERWRPSGLAKSARLWMGAVAVASAEGNVPSFARILTGDSKSGREIPLARELALLPFGLSHHMLPNLMLVLIERALKRMPRATARLATELVALRDEMEQRLGDDGILLCPAYPSPAPRHHFAKLRPSAWAYSGIYNALEFPAAVSPVARTKRGLPIGIQFVSSRGHDRLALAGAIALEKPCTPVEI